MKTCTEILVNHQLIRRRRSAKEIARLFENGWGVGGLARWAFSLHDMDPFYQAKLVHATIAIEATLRRRMRAQKRATR